MATATPKQFLPLSHKPVLAHTLLKFDDGDVVDQICLVVGAQDMETCRKQVLEPLDLHTPVQLVVGGEVRQTSVYKGLEALPTDTNWVVVHDGVRPFVSPEQIRACIEGARDTGACILGIPLTETLKTVTAGGEIEKTLEREILWRAQTPQVFAYNMLCQAHRMAAAEGFVGTDDAVLVERLGHRVTIIPGSRFNIKITTPEDLALSEFILQRSA
jgi:2-C-methyl-D-erythritol 4-phosphate cytidylyltransferase